MKRDSLVEGFAIAIEKATERRMARHGHAPKHGLCKRDDIRP